MELFLSRGADVCCLLRPGRKSLGWLTGLPVTIEYVDLNDRHALEPAISGADVVVHIAGVTKAFKDEEYFVGNTESTRALVEALQSSRTLKRFCLVSSLAAVGPTPGSEPLDESWSPRPITPYGASKLAAEQVCHAAPVHFPWVIVRPPAVYGPRDRDMLQLFRWASLGLFPFTGPPQMQLSILHVHDLARALYDICLHPQVKGKTYFVSNEHPYPLRAIAWAIAQSVGKKIFEIPIPHWVARGLSTVSQLVLLPFGKPSLLGSDRVKDLYAPGWSCSAEAIRREVGFQTEYSLERGMQGTAEWYREQRWL